MGMLAPMDIDRVREARPHFIRAAVFAVAAMVALVLGSRYEGALGAPGWTSDDAFLLGSAAGFLVAGVIAVRGVAAGARTTLRSHAEDPRGAPVGFIISAIGYIVVLFSTVNLLGGNLGGLLLGGALTGVVVGIAAQQTLGNFFAGLVLLLVRPFGVGDRIVMKSAPLGGEYEGLVVEMSMFYVHMQTARGPVALPNAGVLAAAIGPGARSADPTDEDEQEEQAAQGGPAHGGPPPPP